MDDYFDFIAEPKSVWLTVNRGCNFRCRWCYGQSTGFNPNDDMPFDLARKLVLISKEIGAQSINLIGGEPTLWRPLWDLIAFCREEKVQVGLITNASRFSNDAFWRQYQQMPCDYVGISVKSGNSKQFLSTTGTNLFEPTMIGIKRAMSFHKCGFSTVYSQLVGSDGIIEIAQKCKDMGASSMTLSLCSAIMEDGNVSNTYTVEIEQLVKDLIMLYPTIDSLYDGRIVIEMFVPLCLFPKDFIETLSKKDQLSSVCHVHDRSGIVFDTNGNVLPCNTMIGNEIAQFGKDFHDAFTLMKYMNSPDIVETYRALLRYPSIECSSCSFNRRCKGGCILNWTVLDPGICSAE